MTHTPLSMYYPSLEERVANNFNVEIPIIHPIIHPIIDPICLEEEVSLSFTRDLHGKFNYLTEKFEKVSFRILMTVSDKNKVTKYEFLMVRIIEHYLHYTRLTHTDHSYKKENKIIFILEMPGENEDYLKRKVEKIAKLFIEFVRFLKNHWTN